MPSSATPRALADALLSGATFEELRREFPDVTHDDLKAGELQAVGDMTLDELKGDD